MDFIPLIKDVGFPIFCAVVASWMLWQAFKERIKKLETIIQKQSGVIDDLQADRLKRAEAYAQALHDITGKLSSVIRDVSATMREQHNIVKTQHQLTERLINALERLPCAQNNLRIPSSHELPDVPPQPSAPGSDFFNRHNKPV